ncbi:MAG: OstA-like protein [Bacteroidota bacterium]|nr:OstA-like protein [Bacteroidota bacterium]
MIKISSLKYIPFLLIFISTNLFSQQDDKIIILNHADSLVGREIKGESIRELIGNVQFMQGNVVVNCDRAVQYFKTNEVVLTGNVRVQDDTLVLNGKRGIYNGNDKTSEAFEGVHLEEGTRKLFADYGKYFITERRVLFRKNVFMQDTSSNLSCDELIYFRDEKRTIARKNVIISDINNDVKTYSNYFESLGDYSFLLDQPRIVQIDTTDEGTLDTLTIVSSEMHSYQDSLSRFIAIGKVIMKRGDLSAECGNSVYYTDADSIILRDKPFVWYEKTQVSGDSIFIKLKERKLEKIIVRGNAFAISLSDTNSQNRFDQMSGETITMTFFEGKINNILVDVTATSLYYLYETEVSAADTTITVQKPNGINITSGDQITILFEEKKVEAIKIISGVEGKYYPENLVQDKESDYNLAGFNWRDGKPAIPPNPFLQNKSTLGLDK